jgi:hypothetical protein
MEDKKYNEQILNDGQAIINFLEGLTNKIIDITHTVDNHANVMIGMNTGIFVLVISLLFKADVLRITLGIVAFFSFISAFCAILAIRLPHFFTRRYPHEESILHAPRISKFNSADIYATELQKIIKNEDEIFRQYSLEAYNLSKYYYVPKRKMLAWSRYFFVLGVMCSGLFLLLEKLHWFVY